MRHSYEPMHIIFDRLRWWVLGVFILLATLVGFSLIFPVARLSAEPSPTIQQAPVEYGFGSYDGANAVTTGLDTTIDRFSHALDTSDETISLATRSTALALSRTGSNLAHGVAGSGTFAKHLVTHTATFTGHAIGNTCLFAARSLAHGLAFTVAIPGTILGAAADTPVVSAVIKPADTTPLPTINPSERPTLATQTTTPDAKATTATSIIKPAPGPDSTPMWPIHGEITTFFGVPHWPFQPTHTGIDISDGQRSGVTPIKPYRPGRVVDAISSYGGLGNHVIIDHGGGITSVYGHMSSISVKPGQLVDHTTTLGFEGSTGASTGPHVHLEIQVNGQPQDPLQFINGMP